PPGGFFVLAGTKCRSRKIYSAFSTTVMAQRQAGLVTWRVDFWGGRKVMQVAVIGAGVVGVSTAYFLAEAGHEVVVVERRNNVAEEASFGDAGVLATDAVSPWIAPGMAKSLFSLLLRQNAPIHLHRAWNPSLWRW